MMNRGIATVSLALMFCFLLLAHFDSQFFLIHFYESLIYLAIVLMLFYFEDRWAYMLGIVAPTTWIVLTFVSGGLPGMFRQVELAVRLRHPDAMANLIGGVTLLLSLLMIGFCANRWRHEFKGLGKTRSTLLVCLGVAVAYYGFLVVWILRWPPVVS